MTLKEAMTPRSFLGLCLLAAAVGVALAAPPAGAQDVRGVPEGANWRADVNRTVITAQHWTWVLRYVERQGETLTIGLAVKNGAVNNRPLFLGADYKSTIALVDQATAERYPLQSVEGISEQITRVDRSAGHETRFVFDYPEGARAVRFTSVWITAIMAGAVSVMPVDFPLSLPPPEARAL